MPKNPQIPGGLLILIGLGFGLFVNWNLSADDGTVHKLLRNYCTDCHSGDSAEADLQLNSIPLDFSDERLEKQWLTIFDKLEAGEMPPAEELQPPNGKRQTAMAMIAQGLRDANLERRGNEGRVVFRRLNRFEYENTLHDLLQIEIPLMGFLPEDATADGFNKVASALRLSPLHLEQYLAAAGAAIDEALIHEPLAAPIREKVTYPSDVYVRSKARLVLGDGLVLFGGTPALYFPWKAPAQGHYRFNLLLEAHQSLEPLTYSIRAGNFERRVGAENHLAGYFDIEPGAKREITFESRMQAGDKVQFSTFGIDGKTGIRKVGIENYRGPGIWLGRLIVEGPLETEFPPASHQRLFDDLPLISVPGKFNPAKTKRRAQRTEYHEVHSAEPSKDATRLLQRFAVKAFRRPVTELDLKPFESLVHDRLKRGLPFEQAMKSGYTAILCSPDFLFVTQRPSDKDSVRSKQVRSPPRLNDFELASRLSYFLWASMPDDELIQLAGKGVLRDETVLRKEVERMLASPKSQRFVQDFAGQWLDLNLIEFTTPDRRLYPDFDELLQVSMVEETNRFFREILEHDRSVSNFIDSDFAILNERLASHYHIDGVTGQDFRRVELPPDSRRGGVLTQASVLKVTADGTNTSPVLRGVWALERIIGKPVPPPPASVPGIEPDIRGATTIREQLAKHRQSESCSVCHRHIDPLGFAMENFDVIGGWRQHYRSPRSGPVIKTEGYRRQISYRTGLEVDPSGELPHGGKFTSMDQLKEMLAADPEQIARCLTEKLIAYGTGCGVEFADRDEVEAILTRTKPSHYGLKCLIHEIVQSDLFRYK